MTLTFRVIHRIRKEKERASKRQKKSVLSADATLLLQAWWAANEAHPYPSVSYLLLHGMHVRGACERGRAHTCVCV